MYNNIGKKIKILVELITLLLCFSWIIISVGLIYTGKVPQDNYVLDGVFVIAPVILIWISGFITYGFGELIDCTQELKNELNELTETNKDMRRRVERIEAAFYQNGNGE